MAVRITDVCISCDVCLGECPTSSIVNAKDNPTDNNYYYVDPATCTECIGDADSPLCQAACPISDCIVWDLAFDQSNKKHFEGNEHYVLDNSASYNQPSHPDVSIENRISGDVECIIK